MSRGALLILKPDILAGPYAHCDPALARDAIRGLAAVYAPVADPYEVGTSAQAVAWAMRNIERKVRARDWYTRDLHHPAACLAALHELVRGPLRTTEPVAVADLVRDTSAALGFRPASARRMICTRRDYLGLYAENTHFTRLAGSLRDYLVGQPIEVIEYEGPQELSTLHIFKEMLRRVVRYPTTHYDAVENLLHVADPGSSDWAYFRATAMERA